MIRSSCPHQRGPTMSGRRQGGAMKRKGKFVTVALGLVMVSMPLALMAGGGEKQGKLVHVADTRGLTGFNLYFADLYNTNRLLFTLEAILLTAVMGVTLGFIMDKLVAMIGLDLTNQALIDRARFDELVSAGTPLSELLKDDLGNHSPRFLTDPKATRYIWDALASAYMIDPSIATRAQTRYLDVITDFGPHYGGVKIKRKGEIGEGETPVTVLTGLDFGKFFALLKKTLQ